MMRFDAVREKNSLDSHGDGSWRDASGPPLSEPSSINPLAVRRRRQHGADLQD